MKAKTELARKYHENGYNCAQSVLASFAQDHGLSEETALKIAAGFGSGMGRLCEVCGALTGAFMVVGLKHGRSESDGSEYGPRTETTYERVWTLASRFKERNGSIYCRDLVGHDLGIPEEREKAKRDGVFSTVCTKCIEDATDLVQEALEAAPA